MDIAIVVLKSGQTLVTFLEQMDYEPAVHMFRPHTVSGKSKLTLSSWPEHSADEHVLINSDNLLTVCEATDEVRKAYEGKVKNAPKPLKPEPKPVTLTEEENLLDSDDDYEPRYQEV